MFDHKIELLDWVRPPQKKILGPQLFRLMLMFCNWNQSTIFFFFFFLFFSSSSFHTTWRTWPHALTQSGLSLTSWATAKNFRCIFLLLHCNKKMVMMIPIWRIQMASLWEYLTSDGNQEGCTEKKKIMAGDDVKCPTQLVSQTKPALAISQLFYLKTPSLRMPNEINKLWWPQITHHQCTRAVKYSSMPLFPYLPKNNEVLSN